MADPLSSIRWPPGWRVHVADIAVSADRPGVAWPPPPGSLRVRDVARPGMQVCLVVTDATRACPDEVLVPSILVELQQAGIQGEDITLLVATGMHRASTPAEKLRRLGQDTVTCYRVVDHHAQDPAGLVDLGSVGGIPQVVNRLAVEADLVLATGVVEPHQYAGYSGGGKTVVIGCGGAQTIAATHSPWLLDDPTVRLGRVGGNRFQEFVRAATRRLGSVWVVNVVLDADGQVVALASGDAETVHDHLVHVARRLYEVPVPGVFDVVVAGVNPPKDVNLYQASRAATYLGLSGSPPIRPGGVIILLAGIPDGPGDGAGEQAFFATLSSAKTPASVLAELRSRPSHPGEQRAYMVAQILEQFQVIVAGAQHPDVVHAAHMIPADHLTQALEMAASWIGPTARALVVPHALQVMPIPQP